MLDFFLASVRKEPHLGSKRTFKSDGDAPNHTQRFVEPPGHSQLYQLFRFRQAPVTIIFAPSLCLSVQKVMSTNWFGYLSLATVTAKRPRRTPRARTALRRRLSPLASLHLVLISQRVFNPERTSHPFQALALVHSCSTPFSRLRREPGSRKSARRRGACGNTRNIRPAFRARGNTICIRSRRKCLSP